MLNVWPAAEFGRNFRVLTTTKLVFVLCGFQIGKENPAFLLAHAYTRYLGDLSGGQVLGRIAQKSMGLKSGEGLNFFAFPGVSSPNLFKQLYRSRMNSVELTEEEMNGVLEEAVRAFELNIQVRWGESWTRLKAAGHFAPTDMQLMSLSVF